VREPGRHRAERCQPLAILLARRGPGGDDPDRLHHLAVDRALAQRQPREVLRCDHRHPNLGLGHGRDRAHPGGGDLPRHLLEATRFEDQALHDTLQQQEDARVRVMGPGEDGVGRPLADDGDVLP
jgi:hypothetical protein